MARIMEPSVMKAIRLFIEESLQGGNAARRGSFPQTGSPLLPSAGKSPAPQSQIVQLDLARGGSRRARRQSRICVGSYSVANALMRPTLGLRCLSLMNAALGSKGAALAQPKLSKPGRLRALQP